MAKKSKVKPGSKKKAAVLAERPAEGELPTAEDTAFLAANPAGKNQVKPQPYELSFLFTPGIIDAIKKPAVVGFFGEALDPEGIDADAAQASNAAAVHERLQNGIQAVGLLHAPPAKALGDRLSLIMKRWDAFSAAHPAEARALTALKSYWAAMHKGHPQSRAAPAGSLAASGAKDAASGTSK